MIRIGIVIRTSDKWIAGFNYLKNLLFAVSKINGKKIHFVLFVSTKQEKKTLDAFKPYGEIIKTPILNSKACIGFINAGLMTLFNRSFLLNNLFRQHHIDVVSHSSYITGDSNLKTINWITDLQHIRFPEMFSWIERRRRCVRYSRFAKESNTLILSSIDALNDYINSYPQNSANAKVIHFVSQPVEEIYQIKNIDKIREKYGLVDKFFFLPNQLWKHKNHMVVMKALNLLKKNTKDVLVVCTGFMRDFRHNRYAEEVAQYIKENNLENNINFLGFVEYKDVLILMRHCISVINPSLFEGWSSTVEEAKSIGKNMILSNLNVHREQNPPNSIYFDPNNENELARKLWKKWAESNGGPDFELEKRARRNIGRRTNEFGKLYQDIVINTLTSKNEKS